MGRNQQGAGSAGDARGRTAGTWVKAVLFAAFGIGVSVWAVSAAYTQFALRDGVTTQARVVVTQSVGKYVTCEVSYQDSRGMGHDAWIDSQCGGARAGQSVAVRYLPDDPTKVAAVSSLSLSQVLTNESGYLFVGLVGFLFGALGFLVVTGLLGWGKPPSGARPSAWPS